ncbi:response regulator transcription factor [Catenulispora rubra]|uniref:response regulator transcription factor n=1 Tax=Catenulispora rubra TaxID=280293 RepID=UPI0018921895|nr:response regulator transcription factor [Catenulispora rubra]
MTTLARERGHLGPERDHGWQTPPAPPAASWTSRAWSPKASSTAGSARRFFIAEGTATVHIHHIRHILAELGVSTRAEAISLACRTGLVEVLGDRPDRRARASARRAELEGPWLEGHC